MTKNIELEKLNQETSQIAWKELQRFFAGGLAISISNDLDIVEVAYQFSQDNKDLIQEWMQGNRVNKVTDDQAKEWLESDVNVWTVVVKPWILVQLVEIE